MELYVVRHGQTDMNRLQIMQGQTVVSSLDDRGRYEAECIGKRLKNISFDHIFSSDLKRCRETSDIILSQSEYKREPVYTETLRERSKGIFEGGPWENFRKYCAEEKDRIMKAPPGGESLEDVLKRTKNFAEMLKNTCSENDRILAVTHQGLIKILLLCLLDMPLMYHRNFRFDNCSLTVFYLGDKYNRLILANDTCHIK